MSAADWMKDLSPEVRRTRPLSHLVIPGSHNSFTYYLDRTLPVGPDTDKGVRQIGNRFPCVKPVIGRWSKCQRIGVTEQLNNGIRYLDIRVGILPTKHIRTQDNGEEDRIENFRVLHALYGETIWTPLDEVKMFLDTHTHEVIILDIQHTYSFEESDHIFLVKKIETLFNAKLCPKDEDLAKLTLDRMKEKGYQLIVIYPKMSLSSSLFMWPRSQCPNPWPNTERIEVLEPFLNNGLEERDNNALFVSQALLTPTFRTLRRKILSSLEKSLASTCDAFIVKWLSDHPTNMNIVIADFVEKDDIVKLLISINK